jgi:hypothetical protein
MLEPKQFSLLVGLQETVLRANLLRLPYLVLWPWMLELTTPLVVRCCYCWSDRLCLQRSRHL